MKDRKPVNIEELRARKRLNRAKGATGAQPVDLRVKYWTTAYHQKRQGRNPKDIPDPDPKPPKIS